MKIGFAVLVENPFFDRVISIENAVHDEAAFFDRLSRDGNLPHTTLFQGNLRDDIDYVEIADHLAAMIGADEKLRFTHMAYVPEGWYFLECEKTPLLEKLHYAALDMSKPYIILDENRLERKLDNMPQNQIEALRKYGYRYSETAFYPHITIGRRTEFDEALLDRLDALFDRHDKVATIESVSVYKMGANGTHCKTLYKRYVNETFPRSTR